MTEVSSFVAARLVPQLKDLAYFIFGLKAEGVDPKERPGIVDAYKRMLLEYQKGYCAKCKNSKRCKKADRPKAFIDRWLKLAVTDLARLGADSKALEISVEYILNAVKTAFRRNITAKTQHTCLYSFELALKIWSDAIDKGGQKERKEAKD